MNRLQAIEKILKDKSKVFVSGSATLFFDPEKRRVVIKERMNIRTKHVMEYIVLQENWNEEGV